MPPRARLAVLLSSLLHGGLVLAGRYRFSYDAYNHMFFGDHYRMDWWSLWDARWYTGFSVNSYPPLVHQLIGTVSHLIGVDAAFGLLLWIAVTLLPLGVYVFARIFVGNAAAGYAALGAAVLPSVYLTAHIFGQLPTLFGALTALFGAASLARYLKEGGLHNFALTIALSATAMAFHHATLLLQLALIFAVVLGSLLNHGDTKTRSLFKKFPAISVSPRLVARLVLFMMAAIAFNLIVIWPFWDWGRGQVLQTPIDHASRHNFFQDPAAALFFFLPMYGPLLALIPSAFWFARKRRLLGLGIIFGVLFLLGLGGTTPLPRLFFGKGWEWLTYDRFAFWASLLLLPFFGISLILLRRFQTIRILIYLVLAGTSLLVGLTTAVKPLQPGPVDMRPIVSFLEQGDRSNWRYVTFGFGDQMARLSTLTSATTLDGSYHTARTLPELRASGIAQIDTAFWFPDGLASLDPILQKSGEHGVRWGFVNVRHYIPVLERNGWIRIKTLKGGVQVWENPNAVLPEPQKPPPTDPLASFSWGVLPLLSLVASLSLGALRVWHLQAERVLRDIYVFVVSLLPTALGFWYYQTIHEFPHDRIYFTYTDALFFLADALVLLAVILWLAGKVSQPIVISFQQSAFSFLLFTLILLTFLSIFWSRDWRVSLYVYLHILLVCLFVLSLRDWRGAWRSILLGSCAALSLQFLTGAVEFLRQTTAFLAPLGLNWPGNLDPSVRGAVVVELPGGEAFLRAYGTLPHPNILGGLGLILLLGPLAFFLRREKPNSLALLLLLPGVALLALTFSRSAWLALIVFSLVLIWKSKSFNRKRLAIMLAAMAMTFALTLFPYRELVQARTVRTTSHAEEFSLIGRAWLNGEAITMIGEYPLTGVGIGSFILELARRAGEGYVVEPAHNLLLLAGAELGIPGLLLVLALSIIFAARLFKTQHPGAILAGAALTGLGVISIFDHYLWTLAPGRLMLGLVIGLFVGQDIGYES